MAGYEAYREDKSTLKGESSEFAVPLTTSFELNTNPSTQKAEGGLFPQRRLLSQFGRLNYSYAGKYLLTANIRRDGSDRFGPGQQVRRVPLVFGRLAPERRSLPQKCGARPLQPQAARRLRRAGQRRH
jgi:hypothetical protein